LEREVAQLRLEQATRHFERGHTVTGLLELAALGNTAPPSSGANEFEFAIRGNWAVWQREVPTLRSILPAPARLAALSADGKSVLLCAPEGQVSLWNAGTPDVLDNMPAVTDGPAMKPVQAIDLSANGRWAGVQAGGRAFVWDRDNNKTILLPMADASATCVSICFTADGFLLTLRSDQKWQRWRLQSGQPQAQTLSEGVAAISISAAPNGKNVLLRDDQGKILLAKMETGSPVRELPCPAAATGTAWARNGEELVTACADGRLRLWNASDGRLLLMLPEVGTHISVVAASADGRHLLTGGQNGQVQWWDAASARLRGVLPLGQPITAFALAADNRTFLTLDESGSIRIWELPAGWSPSATIAGLHLVQVEWSADGSRVVALSGGPMSHVKICDTAKSEVLVVQTAGNGKEFRSAVLSPDGKLVLIAGAAGPKGEAQLFDLQGKSQGAPWPHAAPVLAVCFRPDGKFALTGTESGTVTLWDVSSGKPIGTPFSAPGAIRAVAFAPDGKSIAIAGDGKDKSGETSVWSLERNERIGQPLWQKSRIVEVSFESGGQIIRTRDMQNVLRRWEVASGQALLPTAPPSSGAKLLAAGGNRALFLGEDHTLRLVGSPVALQKPLYRVSPGEVNATAFSPDRRLLLIGAGDALRLWDTATGQSIGPPLPLAGVRGVAWSPTGSHFLAWNNTDAPIWTLPEFDSASEDMPGWLWNHIGVERMPDGAPHWLSAAEWREGKR
ncbi:MAG TPA: WD40 repeat domain-containing protein, partial [Gemmataceae bacterium]|nr:WD40 repeat domain-containing protein [Gemmataceae bacterium]